MYTANVLSAFYSFLFCLLRFFSTLFSFKVKFHLCAYIYHPFLNNDKPSSVGFVFSFFLFVHLLLRFRFCPFCFLLVGFNLLLPVSVICLRAYCIGQPKHRSLNCSPIVWFSSRVTYLSCVVLFCCQFLFCSFFEMSRM